MSWLRAMLYLWLVVAAVFGAWVLLDFNHEVHGEVAPDFCTDCAQFAEWLEDHDE